MLLLTTVSIAGILTVTLLHYPILPGIMPLLLRTHLSQTTRSLTPHLENKPHKDYPDHG